MKNKKAIIIFFIIVIIIVGIIAGFEVAKSKEVKEKTIVKLPKVSVTKTSTDKFIVTYDASGKISNNTYKISANEVRGKIAEVYVNEGDYVYEGQAVLSLNVTANVAQLRLQLVNTEQGINDINLSIEQLETKKNEIQQLYDNGLVAKTGLTEIEDNIEKLTTKKAGLEETKTALNAQINDISGLGVIYSSESGIVTKNKFKPNQTPTINDYLEIKMQEMPEARIYLTEKILKNITEGDPVEVEIDGKIYQASIKEIHSLNPNETLYPVDVAIDSEDQFLSDMSVTVMIPTYKNEQAVLLDSKAIINFNNETYVYKLVDKKASKTIIKTGESLDGFTEIKKGLTAGESVIVEGQFGIADGDKVEVIK